MEDFEETHADWLKETGGAIPLDPLSQDPGNWDFLKENLPGVIVYSAGSDGRNTILKGLLDGFPFLVESSDNGTSLMVGGKDDLLRGDTVLYGSSFASPLIAGPDDIAPALISLVSNLQVKPFEYLFKAKTVDGYKDGELILSENKDGIVQGYGTTPREGYRHAKEMSIQGLTVAGFTVYSALSLWEAREVDTDPFNEDKRNFPDEDPTFNVVIS